MFMIAGTSAVGRGSFVYRDRKSTRLNSSHSQISYAVFCLKKNTSAKRQPDLTQMMLIMSGGLVQFIPQPAHAVPTMHELQVAVPLIVHTGIVDCCVPNLIV